MQENTSHHSVSAEESILGSIIMDPARTMSTVRDRLRPGDFWVPAHQLIYGAMLELAAGQRPIDVVSLEQCLTKRQHIQRVGGIEYLADLVGKVSVLENVDYHARIVQQKAISRQILSDLADLRTSEAEGSELHAAVLDRMRLVPVPKESRAELCMEVTRLLEIEPRAPDWLIGGLVQRDNCVVIGGEPKTGKTWLALLMALCLATGRKVLDRWEPRHLGKVLLFSPEGGPLLASNRLHQLCWGMQINPREVTERILGLSGRIHVDCECDYQRLLATIEHEQPDVLLLDPLIGVHHAVENESNEMQPVLDRIRDLRQANPGLSVWLVHHTAKGGKDQSRGYALRGSSALTGWYDTLVSVRLPQDEDCTTRRVDVDHRAAAAPSPVGFTLTVGRGLVPGLESVCITSCDAPSLDKKKRGGGRSLDQDMVLRIRRLITEHSGEYLRVQGAAELAVPKPTFSRYFEHLRSMGEVALDEHNRMVRL